MTGCQPLWLIYCALGTVSCASLLSAHSVCLCMYWCGTPVLSPPVHESSNVYWFEELFCICTAELQPTIAVLRHNSIWNPSMYVIMYLLRRLVRLSYIVVATCVCADFTSLTTALHEIRCACRCMYGTTHVIQLGHFTT